MVVVAVAAAPAYASPAPQAGASFATASRRGHIPRAAGVGVVTTRGTSARAVLIHGRGLPQGVLSATQGATAVAIAALLVLVIGGAVLAIVAERRRPAAHLPLVICREEARRATAVGCHPFR